MNSGSHHKCTYMYMASIDLSSNVILDAVEDITERSFGTKTLLLLRQERYEHFSFSDDSVVETFKKCRLDYLKIPDPSYLDTVSDSKSSLDIFRRLWSQLALLEVDHVLYVPPIYESNTINELLLDIVHGVRLREVHNSKFDTAHPIFGGVEGTGKTTLIKALAIAVAVCSNKYFFAMVDFQQSMKGCIIPTPHRIVAEIFLLLSPRSHTYDEDKELLKQDVDLTTKKISIESLLDYCLRRYHLKIGIVVDEIQTVFEVKSNLHEEYLAALSNYQYFARHCLNAMIIMTGSSTKLRTYLFRRSSNLPEYKSYPNFNKSLTKFYSIHALRHHEDIKRYICRRYPQHFSTYSDEALAVLASQIFYNTGGIGCSIHAYVMRSPGSGESECKPIEKVQNINEFRLFLNILRNYQSGDKDHVLENIIAKKNFSLLEVTTDKICIPINNACSQMEKTYAIGNPLSLFETWTDSGYLYADDSDIHLVRPVDAIQYYKNSVSSDDYLRLFGVYVMVIKDHIKNSAGFPLEELVFPRINYFTNWKSNYIGHVVHLGSSHPLCVLWDRDSDPYFLTENNLMQLHEKVFKWDKELGINGIQVRIDPDLKEITLDLWHSKGGSTDGSMKGGNMSTYRKKKMSTDDTMIANVIAKAEKGAMMLGKAFLSCLPQWKFRIGSLLITTTKKIELAETFLQECRGQQTITEEWLNICINEPNVRQRFLRNPYQIKLVGGIDWFLNLLEPELRVLWPV